MKTLLSLTTLFFVSFAWAQDPVRREHHEMHRLHQDSAAYIAMLEDPGRDEYQKPDEVIAALNLKRGETIADIGAGSGYFAFRFAPLVGETGRVYAVDVNPDMILHMNRRARELNASNVVAVLSAPDDPLLPQSSVNRFFICDTWHHIEDQQRYLGLMKKMLKPGGQVVMIDFKKQETPVGPPVEMRISRADLVRQMEGAGFDLVAEHDFLPHQYFLVFSPGSPADEIARLLEDQVNAWNRKDLEEFLKGYWNSPELTFFSQGNKIFGWEQARERYRNRYLSEGREMGRLEFKDIVVEPLGDDTAFVRGRFQLEMSSGETPTGIFTLILRRFPEGWKIVHDHTSG